MPVTKDGEDITVKITEKAAEKIKYFAEKDGTDSGCRHHETTHTYVGEDDFAFGQIPFQYHFT